MANRQNTYFYDISPRLPHPHQPATTQKYGSGRRQGNSLQLAVPVKKSSTVNPAFQEEATEKQQKIDNYHKQKSKDQATSQHNRRKLDATYRLAHPLLPSEISQNYERPINIQFLNTEQKEKYKYHQTTAIEHHPRAKNRNTVVQQQKKHHDEKNKRQHTYLKQNLASYEDENNEKQIIQKVNRIARSQNEINQKLKRMFHKLNAYQ